MRNALVFGGSGQIGLPLLARLLQAGWQVHAVSRSSHESQPRLHWLSGEFGRAMALPERVDAIFSLGPLDRFAQWYTQEQVSSPRVVAFGSTSLETKHASVDDYERDLAARLEAAEAEVFRHAAARGAHATLLRPTLIYGGGHDKTLTRIASMAKRTGFFVLPSGAIGLRQPVHVADLADAAFAVIDRQMLFRDAYRHAITRRSYDVTADDRRFLMVAFVRDATRSINLVLVENWFTELERLSPRNGR